MRSIGFRHTGIGDGQRFVVEPALRFDGFLIDNLEGSILIPVSGLGSFGVGNHRLVNPVSRFEVFRIINFLSGVDSGFKIFKEASFLLALSVDKNFKGIIRAIDKLL